MTVADKQQDSEIANLRTAISLANETLVTLLNATIAANYTSQLNTLATQYASNPSNVSSPPIPAKICRLPCSASCCFSTDATWYLAQHVTFEDLNSSRCAHITQQILLDCFLYSPVQTHILTSWTRVSAARDVSLLKDVACVCRQHTWRQ